MSTINRIVAAVGTVAALAASAGPAAAAPTENAAPSFVPPADYVQLTDDTGTITVAVPNTWTDVSTLPFTDAAGNTIPRITAATNYQIFHDTFDAPGIEYVALPFNADQQGVMSQYGITGGCAKSETVPFARDTFVGLHGIWSDCGTTGVPEWHQIVVAPADNSRTLVLQIQIPGPADAPVLQNVLDSFNIGPGAIGQGNIVPSTPTTPTVATMPAASTVPLTTAAAVPTIAAPTVPGVPTIPAPTVPAIPTIPTPTVSVTTATAVPATAAVPTVPVPTAPVPTVAGVPTTSGAVPPGFVRLVDDTQTISMVVPATWTDIDTTPIVADDGRQTPSIIAATDIEQWESTFSVPGARLVRFPFVANPTALIADIGLEPGSCPSETVEPFSNGVYTGNIGRWSNCGTSGQVEYDVIVASPADQSATFVLLIQSTGPADQPAVATVIGSFGPAAGGGATAETSPPLPPATNALPTTPTPAPAPGG